MNSHRNNRKTGKEQYYTNSSVAYECLEIASSVIPKDSFVVEPCGGTGEFLNAIQDHYGLNYYSCDIEPKDPRVERKDWLKVDEKFDKPFVVITNPPYGRNNSLSARFFNRAALLEADYICFLIPISWRKWSIQNRLDKNYHLVEDVEITRKDMFYGDSMTDKDSEMRCVFQIWERRDEIRERVVIEDNGYLVRSTPEESDIKLTQQSYDSKVLEVFTKFKREKVAGNFYYKIKDKTVIDALEYIRKEKLFREFTDYSMYYTKSISLDEINYLLNKYYERYKGLH